MGALQTLVDYYILKQKSKEKEKLWKKQRKEQNKQLLNLNGFNLRRFSAYLYHYRGPDSTTLEGLYNSYTTFAEIEKMMEVEQWTYRIKI